MHILAVRLLHCLNGKKGTLVLKENEHYFPATAGVLSNRALLLKKKREKPLEIKIM